VPSIQVASEQALHKRKRALININLRALCYVLLTAQADRAHVSSPLRRVHIALIRQGLQGGVTAFWGSYD
jgi:hypothetical protein